MKRRLLDNNNNNISFLTLYTLIITPGLEWVTVPFFWSPPSPWTITISRDNVSVVWWGGIYSWRERDGYRVILYIQRSNEQSPVLSTISYDMDWGMEQGEVGISISFLPFSLSDSLSLSVVSIVIVRIVTMYWSPACI